MVNATFAQSTDTGRAGIIIYINGLTEGDIVSITYSTSLPYHYQNFYIFDSKWSVAFLDTADDFTNETITLEAINDRIIMRINNGFTETSTAWLKIHSIIVNGIEVYPY